MVGVVGVDSESVKPLASSMSVNMKSIHTEESDLRLTVGVKSARGCAYGNANTKAFSKMNWLRITRQNKMNRCTRYTQNGRREHQYIYLHLCWILDKRSVCRYTLSSHSDLASSSNIIVGLTYERREDPGLYSQGESLM